MALIRMKTRDGHMRVDVVDRECTSRSCFWFDYDKGTFVQGRGYTSYHKKPRPVCMRRHLNGCPHPSICTVCRTLQLEGVTECSRCPQGGNVVPYQEKES